MRLRPPALPTVVPAALAALALSLSACSSDAAAPDGAGDRKNALPPLTSLPSPVAALPDSAGYVVQARKDLDPKELADALSAIAALPGVSTASNTRGRIEVMLFNNRITAEQRDDVLLQLAALGRVTNASPTKTPTKAPTKAPSKAPTKAPGRGTPAPAPAPGQ